MPQTKLIQCLARSHFLFDSLRWILEGGYSGHHAVIIEHLVGCGNILDLGCGTGIHARFFPETHYSGVDIDPVYITAARNKFPGHAFEVRDARATELAAGQFDACMISGLLHHLNDPLANDVLAEAVRVIRPSGRVVIWEDIPTRHWWNAVGHVIHRFDLGDFIRMPEAYARLIEKHLKITRSYPMRSGFMDYQVFICEALAPPATELSITASNVI